MAVTRVNKESIRYEVSVWRAANFSYVPLIISRTRTKAEKKRSNQTGSLPG